MVTKTTNHYFCPKCLESWDLPGCDSKHEDECPSCDKPYTPFENKKTRDARVSQIKIELNSGQVRVNRRLVRGEVSVLNFIRECIDNSIDCNLPNIHQQLGEHSSIALISLERSGFIKFVDNHHLSNTSQGATKTQIERLASDWSSIAGERVRVDQVVGTYYGFCSELGALRLYKKYSGKGRVEYSHNLKTWFFALDT